MSIEFYALNINSNKEVAVGLGNVHKIHDSEPLGGGNISADSDFGVFTAANNFLA